MQICKTLCAHKFQCRGHAYLHRNYVFGHGGLAALHRTPTNRHTNTLGHTPEHTRKAQKTHRTWDTGLSGSPILWSCRKVTHIVFLVFCSYKFATPQENALQQNKQLKQSSPPNKPRFEGTEPPFVSCLLC